MADIRSIMKMYAHSLVSFYDLIMLILLCINLVELSLNFMGMRVQENEALFFLFEER